MTAQNEPAAAPRDYFGARVPFLDVIGVEPRSICPGQVEARLPARPELSNSSGFVHGGMIMSALDFVMSAAARSSDPDGLAVSTVDMTTSFLLGAQGDLLLRAQCLRQGQRLAFCEAQALDGQGRIVAKSSGTFSIRPRDSRRPSSGRPESDC